ncbi:MAG: DNA-3-methyladenine glycosylase [Bradyrhizobium sp.]|nr:DNA-3-methyladenine glycosylase [Bradyrhizobium sp.]
MDDRPRCAWAGTEPVMCTYHDREWGVPEHDGRALWEKLVLDGFQAGLSWSTILNKRDAFRAAFAGFDPDTVARFGERDIERLLGDAGIVRSRAKIEAAIGGARAYLAMRDAGEDFADYCWAFVDGEPLVNNGQGRPTQTPLSEAIAKDLKTRGFKFCGPTIVYAWMQATGLVNDHEASCFRRAELAGTARGPRQ